MVAHTETGQSPYLPGQLFQLVADIERYPEFLPWCSAARILSKNGNVWLADLVISFKSYHETYTSQVTLHAPDQQTGEARIIVEMTKGPFTHLFNQWQFIPNDGGGTSIVLELDFQFRSAILDKLIGFMFEKALQKMTDAFTQRAAAIYGDRNLPEPSP